MPSDVNTYVNAGTSTSGAYVYPTISPLLHGHFAEHLGACVDTGLWVGESSKIPNTHGYRTDVLHALQRIEPPVLRWPGGCFADDYHWCDGIGAREKRPRTVNIHWGHYIETNEFGTHEFLDLCKLLGTAPYIAGNLASATPQEMRNWVEYCNFAGDSSWSRQRAINGSPQPWGVSWWGVGNENWACGGNYTATEYAARYRHFVEYLRDYSGTKLTLVACGPNGNDLAWTRGFFENMKNGLGHRPRINAFAAHYYCGTAGGQTTYTNDEFYHLLHKATFMETLVTDQRALMDEFDPERKIQLLVDEWGTWHEATPGLTAPQLWQQQNTVRDALVAAITLDIFHRHADKVAMANIAQVVNVLQSLLLTDGDKMCVTPTYHIFDLYRPHKGGTSLPIRFGDETVEYGDKQSTPLVSGSASRTGDTIFVTLSNVHATESVTVNLHLDGVHVSEATAQGLFADGIHAHNTYDSPDAVGLRPLTVNGTTITLPPASVAGITLRVG